MLNKWMLVLWGMCIGGAFSDGARIEFLKEEPASKRGLNNIGLWMVEEQPDGTFELRVYNDGPVGKPVE